MRFVLFKLLIFSHIACAQNPKTFNAPAQDLSCQKTDAEWKAQLDDNAYYVLREAGTERPFSGLYNNHYKEGVYKCVGCEAPLYVSDHKYDSGSGWPAFDRAVEGAVSYKKDNKLGYTRIELICSSCGGHLGHLFNDGPRQTTGQRHCINSVALSFVSDE